MIERPHREFHPYGEYLTRKRETLIIGSFPIGKFTDPKRRHEIKEHEIDFYYGGECNHLWKILAQIFDRDLSSKEKIIAFLEDEKISMGDVIKSCRRKNGGASDSDLFDIEWNKDLHDIILKNHFKRLYFTSKKVYHWYLKHIAKEIGSKEGVEEIVLPSPSGSGVRTIPALVRDEFYKNAFKKNFKE